MTNESPGRRFRELIRREPCLWTTGVHAPIEAKIAQSVGLPFVYVSGYSCSLAYLVKADLGFVTQTEMVA